MATVQWRRQTHRVARHTRPASRLIVLGGRPIAASVGRPLKLGVALKPIMSRARHLRSPPEQAAPGPLLLGSAVAIYQSLHPSILWVVPTNVACGRSLGLEQRAAGSALVPTQPEDAPDASCDHLTARRAVAVETEALVPVPRVRGGADGRGRSISGARRAVGQWCAEPRQLGGVEGLRQGRRV